MRRGKIGIHSCRLTPERGVRYGLRRCKIAIEVPSKIVILAGADSPLKFLYFPSSFLEGFPPSSSFGFSFFFSLFTIVFRLLSFFLLKIRNDEKKTFLLRFSFSFLLVEKKERKKAEKGAFCSRWDDENDAVGMGTKQSGIIQSLILL